MEYVLILGLLVVSAMAIMVQLHEAVLLSWMIESSLFSLGLG